METSPAVTIPRLETPRLLVREYRMADFDAFAANSADADATVFTGLTDRRTAWRVFACHTGMWTLQGAGWWMLEQKEVGRTVGYVGAFLREGWPEIELGWVVYRAFWGNGFATEAMHEVIRYTIEVRREKRVTALIDPANGASLRVAARLGLQHESETECWGKPVGRYVRAAGAAP
jgi:RimJ/RimL family protein N-acetyltransferase